MSSSDVVLRDHALRLVEAAAARPDGLAPIVRAGHPALRAVAVPFDGQLSGPELAALLSLMRRTMRAAPGVGLAAPQVGLPLALAVLEDPGVPDPAVAAVRERAPLAPTGWPRSSAPVIRHFGRSRSRSTGSSPVPSSRRCSP